MSGDTSRDLFSLTLGCTHEPYQVNICLDGDRFSLAEYTVIQNITWYKARSDHYQHEFLLVEFKHAKLVSEPLYCIVTRGTSEIKEVNVEYSELDKEYDEDALTTPLADIPPNQMDKTGDIRVIEGQDYINQVHANPDSSNKEVAKMLALDQLIFSMNGPQNSLKSTGIILRYYWCEGCGWASCVKEGTIGRYYEKWVTTEACIIVEKRVAQSDARAVEAEKQVMEEMLRREAAGERARHIEVDNARKDTTMAQMQQKIAALSGNLALTH
ncbi:hypothetical protein BU17DRAFT_66083 [Hysterangium stoloniferum]|nr:hypothetical protein BU17DRAFT_66083 [Hysterangium stoloniferum]